MFFKPFITIVLVFMTFQVIAQDNRSYCVTGQTIDSSNSKIVPFAHIETDNKTLSGQPLFTTSDSNGRFKLCYHQPIKSIRFSLVGYHNKTMGNIQINDSVFNLGKVPLRSSTNELQGFSLKAKKEEEPITIEKKTYSVSQNILATGGTAIDALKQIPAVNVDADGNISLRGSNNITIYINGKQSSLSGADRQAMLMQIPAANIESIDVNTNPGAKQDAEGMSGIINITLKQNTSKTKNGYITLGAGTHNKYNGTDAFPFCHKNIKASKSNCNRIWSKIPDRLITVGDHIRKKRIELGLFQKDVAKIIDVSEDCITIWEKGRSKPMKRYEGKIIIFLGYNPFQNA